MPATSIPSFFIFVKARISYWKRQLQWVFKCLRTSSNEMIRFRCNVCSKETRFPRNEILREPWSCQNCGSCVRFRSVIHALSMELFGTSLTIANFPARPDLVGIGLSDWNGYAMRLEEKLGYTNTYYHKAPYFDITSVKESQHNQFNFVISSDVFEHVCQPISKAFANARKILRPGGVMIMTVPYVPGVTLEHFPDLCHFALDNRDGQWVLAGTTVDGQSRVYSNLTFHGGPGTTVEFRLFGKDSLLEEGALAGFDTIRMYDETVPEFGIYWNPYIAENAPYRPLILGLDTPPWAFSKNISASSAAE